METRMRTRTTQSKLGKGPGGTKGNRSMRRKQRKAQTTRRRTEQQKGKRKTKRMGLVLKPNLLYQNGHWRTAH